MNVQRKTGRSDVCNQKLSVSDCVQSFCNADAACHRRIHHTQRGNLRSVERLAGSPRTQLLLRRYSAVVADMLSEQLSLPFPGLTVTESTYGCHTLCCIKQPFTGSCCGYWLFCIVLMSGWQLTSFDPGRYELHTWCHLSDVRCYVQELVWDSTHPSSSSWAETERHPLLSTLQRGLRVVDLLP